MTAISDRIMRRTRAQTAHGTRLVFSARDFLDFGGRDAVDQALSRLCRAGSLRRVSRGMYDIPKVNPIMKRVAAPDVDAVVDAIARRDGSVVVRNGMAAANRLGLTNAVSARNDYLTDGPSRTVRVGRNVVRLRHAGARMMSLGDTPSGDVVRALHWLGRDMACSDTTVDALRRLPDGVKKDLARTRASMAGWTAEIADRVLSPA